jgi:hypothetical protein
MRSGRRVRLGDRATFAPGADSTVPRALVRFSRTPLRRVLGTADSGRAGLGDDRPGTASCRRNITIRVGSPSRFHDEPGNLVRSVISQCERAPASGRLHSGRQSQSRDAFTSSRSEPADFAYCRSPKKRVSPRFAEALSHQRAVVRSRHVLGRTPPARQPLRRLQRKLNPSVTGGDYVRPSFSANRAFRSGSR